MAMLLQFVVENVLSFRDKAVLSMLAADGVQHGEAHCVRLPGLSPVLKCAAIYGANASGKSNLVKAFEAARRLVVTGTKAGEQIPLRRFKLDPASLAAPSRFEFDLYAAGRRYSYGFVVTPEEVESEWLFVSDGGEERPLFEREQPQRVAERPAIMLGSALTEDEARRRFVAFVAEGTRPNQLFLTECAERNVSELGAVTKWFRSGVAVDRPSIIDFVSEHRIEEESEAFRDYLGKLLKGAGTGISHITVDPRRESEIPSDDLIEETQRVMQATRQTLEASFRGLPRDSRVKLHHPSRAGALVPFVLDEESDGTRRLMALVPFLFDLLQPSNGAPSVHLIDELDRSLHPLLTRFFLETFLCSSTEHPGQILFTTHDTNLLDLNLLSRDSIWFTEKNAGGASSLYSLSEFKGEQLERIGEHLEEGYLHGRFGAIPFLGDPRRLGWNTGGKE